MATEVNDKSSVLAKKIAARWVDAGHHYDEEKAAFFEIAGASIAAAVAERAEPMLLAQYEYEAWSGVKSKLGRFSAADLLEDIHESILDAVGYGFPSQFCRAADNCKLKAARAVYRELRSLIESYA